LVRSQLGRLNSFEPRRSQAGTISSSSRSSKIRRTIRVEPQDQEQLLDVGNRESIQFLLSVLPEEEQLGKLADIYLQEFAWVSYVIDPTELHSRLAKVKQVRSNRDFGMSPSESATFNLNLVVLVALCAT
jgi:hypothetical protein